MAQEKTFPLRIPAMWGVVQNSFGDVDPIVEEGRILNSQYFDEDLLVIERMRPIEGGGVAETKGHLLDMAWRPYGDPKGSYRLSVMHGSRDNMLFKFSSQDRYLIHTLVEQALALVTRGVSDKEIHSRLQQTAARSEKGSHPFESMTNIIDEEPLMPLRVPKTWAVLQNSFGNEDPIIENGRIHNSQYFDEDLLVLQRARYVKGEGYATNPQDYRLTLAWLPSGDPNGSYQLRLLYGNQGVSVFAFSSPDRYLIRILIEQALVLAMTAKRLFEGLSQEEISQSLQQIATQSHMQTVR